MNARYRSCMALGILFCPLLPANATPIIGNAYVQTDNFGANPAGFPLGHTFIIGASGVSDPDGTVPDYIASVEAAGLSGQGNYTLPFTTLGPAFSGVYQYAEPFSGQQGRWSITVTNNAGGTASRNTNLLQQPQAIPLANNLAATGSLLAPLVTWDPVLFDHDLDTGTQEVEVNAYAIRLLNDKNSQFYQSPRISGNSFLVPTGFIVPGITTIRLMALDLEGPNQRVENRSSTFTSFTAVPEPTVLALMGLGLAGIGYSKKRKQAA